MKSIFKLPIPLFLSAFITPACQGTRPSNLGVETGKLAPCPSKPNCVSSDESTDQEHRIDPLPLAQSAPQSIATLETIVKELPRTRILEKRDNYMAVEFESRLLRFVDDVEFFVPSGQDKVHVRSASRLGHSDLGANRKRIESIRTIYLSRLPAK